MSLGQRDCRTEEEIVTLSPDLKAAALAESDSPEDFLILAAVLFTRFSWGFML